MGDPKWDECLPVVFDRLVTIQLSGSMLDKLAKKKLLTLDERSQVDSAGIEVQKVRSMIDLVRKKAAPAFDDFCTILELGYPQLANDMRSIATSKGQTSDSESEMAAQLSNPSKKKKLETQGGEHRGETVEREGTDTTDAPAMQLGSADVNEFRILAVCDEWSSEKGGVSTFNRTICKALAQEAMVTEVVCMLTGDQTLTCDDLTDASRSNVKLFRVDSPDKSTILSEIKPNLVLGHQGVPRVADNLNALEDLLKEKRIEHTTVYILHVYPFTLEPVKRSEGAAKRADEKERKEIALAKKADVVAAVGPLLYDKWSGRLQGIKQVVRLDPGLYDDVPTMTSREPLSNTRRCLFVSRLDKDSAKYSKGLDVATEAMKLYGRKLEESTDSHTAVFVVRGFENSEAADKFREDTAPQLGRKVEIEAKEFLAHEEAIRDEMKGADVFLMPSKHEGFGLVALEALSVGTPVICTEKSGFADILKDIRETAYKENHSGAFISSWIVAPKDVKAYGQDVLLSLWSMVGTNREQTLRDARELQNQWRKRYSWSDVARTLLAACTSLD